MSRRRWQLAVALALLLVGVALLARFVILPARTPPVAPTDFVPQTWEVARTAPMHTLHVGEKQVACTRCHEGGFAQPPSLTTCAASDCHAKPAANAHHGSEGAPTTCLTCHVFRGGARPAACVDCHGPNATAATAPRLAHHGSNDATCTNCHAVHGEPGKRTNAADCRGCHTNVTASHGRLAAHPDAGLAGAQVCTSCHRPHRGKAEAAASCAGCHADATVAAPQVASKGTTTGHPACTTCHAPHATGGAAAACGRCHGGQTTLAAERVPQHAQCTSCHQPHRPAASKENACATCHAGVSPTHGEKRACTSCHAAHPGGGEAAASCSSCHRSAANDHAFHAGKLACAQCHVPHAFELASVRPDGAHPRTPNPAAGAFCGHCHGGEAKAARPGHDGCTSCHGEAHAPVRAPSGCPTCHAAESRTAPKGHATCSSCHDAHSGKLGAHQACTSCHEDKARTQHGNLASGCGSCHRAHGPKGPASPPSCASCHASTRLSGLHQVKAHAPCATCHTAHAPPRATRATCTGSCHVDRRTHQPGAQACNGCHLFR